GSACVGCRSRAQPGVPPGLVFPGVPPRAPTHHNGSMLRQLLSGYAALEGRYDELLSEPAQPRPHWDAFLHALAGREGNEVSDTLSLMEREIREHGITYNVYADPKGADRLWEVDPLPLLLSAGEWEAIETGISQ